MGATWEIKQHHIRVKATAKNTSGDLYGFNKYHFIFSEIAINAACHTQDAHQCTEISMQNVKVAMKLNVCVKMHIT